MTDVSSRERAAPPPPVDTDTAAAAVPRDTSRDGQLQRIEAYALSHGAPLWNALRRVPPLNAVVNRALINRAILTIPPRPNPLSTMASYTSWPSLTDRTFDSRHLPPSPAPSALPDLGAATALFARTATRPCPKSTVFFAYFAQWLTDGFLRSDRGDPPDPRKNTSNHEIDLCQVYGLTESVTRLLRSGDGGLLKAQDIDGEEYPPFLCSGGVVRPEFRGLSVVGFDELTASQRDRLFALGGDRSNSQLGYTAISVLFLREHNRIARLLAAEYPRWDDERLFQTARNVLTILLIRIIIEEYVNHITPYHFRFRLDPTVGRGSHGMGRILVEASGQRAGRIALHNTAPELLHLERASLQQARTVELAPYNAYRAMIGVPRATSFAQLTADRTIQRQLRELYGHVDRLEYFVGLFAEDLRPNSALPNLVGRLVAADAFSQVLTNPLLAPRVFTERTFSPLGMRLLRQPCTLGELVRRNVGRTEAQALRTGTITMTWAGWRRQAETGVTRGGRRPDA
ncbi:peroxidase family protein [Cryptosporangium aurantiacum]|uniref:Prostaglandin-endoperoxide synthase 2 n=1 Tax=Cryptosporangium aurantiacum TaxID=134849 RepID=A0A1M7R2A2_9ACTN|nr:peroxidase family protein [Cryptosporangium aurantiacum]SHN38850.1 prostaglandin-endoperoxide synthase 2 [Cryptosporangium aurantiacum]